MKVAFIGYRQWAAKIFENLVKHNSSLWEISDVLEADVVLYYGWSWMIPKEMYEKKLCLILHTSPLPKYRGGSPLQNQIIKGEKMSATTILKVEEKIDTGAIYAQSKFSLDGTLDEIFERIIEVGTVDTIKVLDGLSKGKIKAKKQNDKKATYFKRRTAEQSKLVPIDFDIYPAKKIYDLIRSLNDPYPNAFIVCGDGKKLYLTGAHL